MGKLDKNNKLYKIFLYDPDFDDSDIEQMSEKQREKLIPERKSVPFLRGVVIQIMTFINICKKHLAATAVGFCVFAMIVCFGGSAVLSFLSKTTVPTVGGMTVERAELELQGRSFTMLVGEDVYSSVVEKGLVAYADDEGTRVKKGSEITVYISKGPVIHVTSVIGMDEKEAKKALKDQGLKVTTEKAYSDDFDKDIIMAQSIAAGDKADQDDEILITISKGSKPFKIKDYTGKTKSAAKKAIKKKGLKVKVKTNYSDTVPVGQVMTQSPLPGSKVRKGDTVIITISEGVKKVTVPSLYGKTFSEATSILHAEGLKTGTASSAYSDSVKEGCVMSQSVGQGAVVEKGTYVTLKVSLGKEPKVKKPVKKPANKKPTKKK